MENVEDIYAVTPVQEGILFHTISEPGSGVYVEQYHCRYAGEFDPVRFESAWQRVFDRHPALRTIFLWEDIDEPLQVVRKEVTVPWQHLEWREFDAQRQEEELQGYLSKDRVKGFTLTEAPVSRMLLARLTDDEWQFVWTFHHLLLDGWSMPMVIREVLAQYSALERGGEEDLPSPPPFSNYLGWLQAQDVAKATDFWKSELAGFSEPSSLRLEQVPEEADEGSQRTERVLGGEQFSRLTEAARRHRVTMNTAVHGAWALLLHAWTGRDDLVFGSTVSGRPASLPGVEAMIGCCINTLPFRVRVDADETVGAWLRRLQERHVRIRDFESTSLAKVQSWSEVAGGTPLFDSIVVFENYPVAFDDADGGQRFTASAVDVREQSNFPLALLAVPQDEGLRLMLVHDTNRFPVAAAERLLAHLEALLTWLADHAEATVAESPPLGAEEAHRLQVWSAGPNLTAEPAPVPHLIERIASATPEGQALVYRDRVLSYKDLNRRAGVLAAQLKARGVKPGERVGLCVERSIEMIVGLLGILKAGCAYVPLDPSYPPARLAQAMEDSRARAILQRRTSEIDLHCGEALFFEEIDWSGEAADQESLSADSLAYVIHTSGSTGKPKGVGVTHANLAASTAARFDCYRDPVDAFLLLSPFSFDSSIVGIFWTLGSGGTLVLPADGEEKDLEALAGLMKRHSVTHTLCLPSLWALLLEHASGEDLQSLQVAIMAGEECPGALCCRHRAQLPECDLHNEYGPTEATVWCSAWKMEAEPPAGRVPIGRPVPGARIHVLNARLQPVPIGVAGELFVAGAGLTPGYLSDPEQTADRFIESPFPSGERLYRTGDRVCWLPDGNLLYLGRTDGQVKVRGHRIELGEVEAILASHPAVELSAVVVSSPTVDHAPDALARLLEQLDPGTAEALLAEVTN